MPLIYHVTFSPLFIKKSGGGVRADIWRSTTKTKEAYIQRGRKKGQDTNKAGGSFSKDGGRLKRAEEN